MPTDLSTSKSLSAALARVRERAERGKTFMIYGGPDGREERLEYGTVFDRLDRIGALFAGWGLRPGDRLLIASRDDGAVTTLVLGCLTHGISAVIADPFAKPAEAKPFFDLARPAAAVIDPELRNAWPIDGIGHLLTVDAPAGASAGAGAIGKLKRLFGKKSAAPARGGFPGILEDLAPARAPEGLTDELEAYVLFTSGSTSRPKGVRISRSALLVHLRTLSNQWGYDPDSRIHDALQLHHADGIFQGPAIAWMNAAACVRPERFTVDTAGNLFAAVYRERITHLVSVPAILAILLQVAEGYEDSFKTPDFRLVVSTGGYLEERVWTLFQERFGVRVANVYGLTETVIGGCFAGPGDDTRRVGTVGKPVDCEVALLGEDGRVDPIAARGPLVMRGRHVMIGYLDDEAATSAALVDGWLRTGDLGAIDAEGFVRIVGRIKNLVITGGLNIQPEEAAEALLCIPGVTEAVAFGVPDETFVEVLVACVALAEGCPLDEGALVEACRALITDYKVPKSISIVPSLPRGPAGKVIIPEARKLFLDAQKASSTATGDVHERVLAMASRSFHSPIEHLRPEDGPGRTPGWDSFAHLNFAAALERCFEIRLTASDIMNIRSLAAAEQVVRARLHG